MQLIEHADAIGRLTAFSGDGTQAEALVCALRDGTSLADPADVTSGFEPETRTSLSLRRAGGRRADSGHKASAMLASMFASMLACSLGDSESVEAAVGEGFQLLDELWQGDSEACCMHTSKAALIARGTIEVVVLAMRMHPSHVEVQTNAVMLLGRLGTSNCLIPDSLTPRDRDAPAVIDPAAEAILSRAEFAAALEATAAAMRLHEPGKRAESDRGTDMEEDLALKLHRFGAAALLALTLGVGPAARRKSRLIDANGIEIASKSMIFGGSDHQRNVVLLLNSMMTGVELELCEKIRRRFVASDGIENLVEVLRGAESNPADSSSSRRGQPPQTTSSKFELTTQCVSLLHTICMGGSSSSGLRPDSAFLQRALNAGAVLPLEAAAQQEARRGLSGAAQQRRPAGRSQHREIISSLLAGMHALGGGQIDAGLKARDERARAMAEQLLAEEELAKESAKSAKAKPTRKDRAKPAADRRTTEPPARSPTEPSTEESTWSARPSAESDRTGSSDASRAASGVIATPSGVTASPGTSSSALTDKAAKKREKRERQKAAKAAKAINEVAANEEGFALVTTTQHASETHPAEPTPPAVSTQSPAPKYPGTESAPLSAEPSTTTRPTTCTNAVSSTVDAMDDDGCVVCMNAAKTHAFIPCGHACACARCSKLVMDTTSACPYCRATAMMATRIYGT